MDRRWSFAVTIRCCDSSTATNLFACSWRTLQLRPQCWVDVVVNVCRTVCRMPQTAMARETRHWSTDWQNLPFSDDISALTCPTAMAVYVLDSTVVNAIWELAILSGFSDKRLVRLFGVPLDTKYAFRSIWTGTAILRRFRARVTASLSGNLAFHSWAWLD